jgi:hypothetical protein
VRRIYLPQKEESVKTMFRSIALTVSAGFMITLLASDVYAGCGDLSNLQAPFRFAQTISPSPQTASAAETGKAIHSTSSASIVGLWKVQLVSMGNTTHNPSIPDGALIDFGYTQWHSDGTEILNSGGHSAATGNFCLGVWGQTGFLTFELNHFPISYSATTGAIVNYVNLREQDTLSPSGDSYTGTFTLDIYDTAGDHVDHLAGIVNAARLTVDSTLPNAIPTNTISNPTFAPGGY